MRSFSLTLFLFALYRTTNAGSLNKGDPCNTGNNRLQIGTFQFWDECNSVTFCSEKNICEPKRCRSDDFPFGYPQGSGDVPPKCPKGQFCPDEGSDCQPVMSVGSPCQLNRDDQCEGPSNFAELADTGGRGLNYNGSVCLNNVCMWANGTAGSSCTVENTPYIVYGIQGEFIDIVSRGSCKIGHYCDSSSKTCIVNKALNAACAADKECDSSNCMSNGVCGLAAATPRHLGVYVYVLVAFAIIGGMGGVLFFLYVTHRKQRETERAKRAQYWREQNTFHQNLMQMRETARASILSLPQHSRELSDESHAPMLQNAAPKASGLRNFMDNNSSSDFDDNLMMRSGGKGDVGRF